MDFWRFERDLISGGFEIICGIDEAGRGPLAGPVFAAAVVLPFDAFIPKLDDSKKLSEKARDSLYDEILEKAKDYGIASADHKEIDEKNILSATFLAMNRAVGMLKIAPDFALIDGNRDPGINCRSQCIVGGDGKSALIAAASILAKVSRDRYMKEMADKYPQYGFEKHKGYGTKLHYERLREHGPSDIHRITFLKKWKAGSGQWESSDPSLHPDLRVGYVNRDKRVGCDAANPRQRGKWGESIALEYLEKKGYTTLAPVSGRASERLTLS